MKSPFSESFDRPSSQPVPAIETWEWVAVALATVVGMALRFWNLHDLPPGLWYDEAIIGLGTLEILHKPGWPVFFMIEGHPEEPLFYYLNALGVGLFGASGFVLRATSAVIGSLTIPLVWWMARRLSGPRVALLAVIFFATMRWHVHFSRLSFRTLLSPMFAVLIIGLLHRALQSARPRDAVACGFAMGLSLYTYLSMRLFVPIAGVAWVLGWWWGRREPEIWPGAREWKLPVIVGGTAMLVFLPLGVDYVRHPEHFKGRQDEVTLVGEDGVQWGLLARQTRDVALMGIVRGDHVPKHNLPGRPQFGQISGWTYDGPDAAARWWDLHRQGAELPDVHGTGKPVFDWLIGVLFYGGLALVIVRAFRRDWTAAALVVWIGVGSMASVLSYGAPNMLRLLYLTPAVAMVLALALDSLAQAISVRINRRVAMTFCVGALVWFAVGETKRYFVDWPTHPAVWGDLNSDQAQLARELRTLPDRPKVVVVPEYLMGHPTFRFETSSISDALVPDAEFDAKNIEGEFWVVVPRRPMPPVRIDDELLKSARMVAELRRPDGEAWARVVKINRRP